MTLAGIHRASLVEVATAHLTEKDNRILSGASYIRACALRENEEPPGLDYPVAGAPDGYFYKLPAHPDMALYTGELSPSAVEVLNQARAAGARAVYFHRDGEPVEGIPTHTW